MATASLGAESAQNNLVILRPRPRPLRADVPPFDPQNALHLRAWENMWDVGQRALQAATGEARHG